jgi:FGGY-family pentulose kinase
MGIDVGTSSVRCGIYSASGESVSSSSHPIQTWTPEPKDYYEQSSADIWSSCCVCARAALEAAPGVVPGMVRGIGFDATCSLVVLGKGDTPLAVGRDSTSTSTDTGTGTRTLPCAQRNVILWMDHRAAGQADRINATKHRVLDFVGGKMSPEMQMPKLLWLKENAAASWASAEQFFDLADYLTYEATGCPSRSMCTVTCKWGYTSEAQWDGDFMRLIGLGDLAEDGFSRIGSEVLPLGAAVGQGLAARAATALGLLPGTPVGVGIIDAHAGGLGLLGSEMNSTAEVSTSSSPSPRDCLSGMSQLALICGTSSCHMVVSPSPAFVPGVWGPYRGAMLPGLWLNEGGQSATGALIDHTIRSHTCYADLQTAAGIDGTSVYAYLNKHLESIRRREGLSCLAFLSEYIHVCPDHHGNRSPLADPSMRGMVVGLTLSATMDDLAVLYLATVQAIAYGTRHIVDTLNKSGYRIDTILACGGDSKNDLFIREHCDITGCKVVLAREPEAVLLGAAVLGAAASGEFGSSSSSNSNSTTTTTTTTTRVESAMASMCHAGATAEPDTNPALVEFHRKKYEVFLKLIEDQLEYKRIMRSTKY